MKTSFSLKNNKPPPNKQANKQTRKHLQIVVVLWNWSHSSVYSGRTGSSVEKNYSKSFGPFSLETKKGSIGLVLTLQSSKSLKHAALNTRVFIYELNTLQPIKLFVYLHRRTYLLALLIRVRKVWLIHMKDFGFWDPLSMLLIFFFFNINFILIFKTKIPSTYQ